jgi:hypothetical protein
MLSRGIEGLYMVTNVLKWIVIVGLPSAVIGPYKLTDYEPVLDAVVFLGALVVVWLALQQGEKWWATCFFVMALLFNPFLPALTQLTSQTGTGPIGCLFLLLMYFCILPFALSLLALRFRPVVQFF